MTRPFVFRINAAELFAEVQALHPKQRSRWVEKFSQELLTLKPTLSYSEKVIAEAFELIEKKRNAGLKGGRPKKAEVKQRLSTAKAKAKLEVEEEKEIKEEAIKLPEWMPLEEWRDFVQNRIKLKKPMTDLAMKQIVKKLENWKTVYDPAKVLSRAIANNWQDLYTDDSCKYALNTCVTPEWL